jgi:6-phospho-beta-glucosidase
MSGARLVVIGGSSPHTPNLFEALAGAGDLGIGEICLVGRSAEHVERVGRLCEALAQRLNLQSSVSWNTDLATAARDADIVLNVLRVGGTEVESRDRLALAASGIVGHAASYVEAIRHLPPTLEAAALVEAVAPDAVFINFSNPVSVLCEALATQSGLKIFGVCHHAFSMAGDFAGILGVSPERVCVRYAGLNHLGWVTDVLVDGQSQMVRLLAQLTLQRCKEYDYELVRAFDAVPVKHAAALYHKGEVFFVRANGPRVSAVDTLARYGGARAVQWWTGRQLRRNAKQPVSWYATCIVPFLRTLRSDTPHEHIVTWQHRGQITDVLGRTAETTVEMRGIHVTRAAPRPTLPRATQEWVRQVRTSECMLIDAVLQRSVPALVDALAIHPSVASVAHAQAFVRRYAARQLANV